MRRAGLRALDGRPCGVAERPAPATDRRQSRPAPRTPANTSAAERLPRIAARVPPMTSTAKGPALVSGMTTSITNSHSAMPIAAQRGSRPALAQGDGAKQDEDQPACPRSRRTGHSAWHRSRSAAVPASNSLGRHEQQQRLEESLGYGAHLRLGAQVQHHPARGQRRQHTTAQRERPGHTPSASQPGLSCVRRASPIAILGFCSLKVAEGQAQLCARTRKSRNA